MNAGGRKVYALATLAVALFAAQRVDAEVSPSFAGRLVIDTPVSLTLEAKGALSPWRMMHASGMTERPDGTRDFAFSAPDAPRITGTFRVENCAGGSIGDIDHPSNGAPSQATVEAEWIFTPDADVRMEMFGLMGDLRMSDYGGGTVTADGETIRLPIAGHPENVERFVHSRLELSDAAGGRRLVFNLHEPVRLFIQYWGGKKMSLRLILPPDILTTGKYKGGVARRLAFSLTGAGPCEKTSLTPITIEAGPDWIPLSMPEEIVEGSALDFSALRPTGKPAGKFGRVVARGEHFEFEGKPGVPQRFYGVNLCGLVNYPETDEDARKLARTFARAGYNAVRIHHHDGWCIDKEDPMRVRLDETMMRRMDSLIAACIEEGIYISTDLFVSRTRNGGIPWRAAGVDRDGNMSPKDMAFCAPIHEGVYSNFLAFAGNWLTHTNAVTGRRYADEPAIAWLSLVNEGDIDRGGSNDYLSRPGWREAWGRWLAAKKAREPGKWDDISTDIPNGLGRDRQGRAFLCFLQDVEFRFIKRTRAFVRSLGCKALITDMNDATLASSSFEWLRSEACDYVDVHFYVDHPQFLEKDWALPSWCKNSNPFKEEAAGAAIKSAVRILNRPFTVSEYNFAWPGTFRSVGGIAAGAEAALQDWSGLWRFAWAHHPNVAMRPGSEPPDFFDIASDPLQLASERASVCLFLRGDAKPLQRTYAVTLPEGRIASPDSDVATSARADWVWAAWSAKIGAIVGDQAPAGAIHAGDFDEAYMKSSDDVRRDLGMRAGEDAAASIGFGAVTIDPVHGTFRIDTPLTCGVFAENGTHQAGHITIKILPQNQSHNATTVWASSLDGLPLPESRRILVTHLTDVQNSGEEFADAEMTILKTRGNLPCLVRNGAAVVELALEGSDSSLFAVYALGSDGRRECEVPATYDAATGTLRFTASVRQPFGGCMCYEIVRETTDAAAPVPHR